LKPFFQAPSPNRLSACSSQASSGRETPNDEDVDRMLGGETRRSPVAARLNEWEDSITLPDGIKGSGSQSSGVRAFGDSGRDSEVHVLSMCLQIVNLNILFVLM